jgi:hypothetical protein
MQARHKQLLESYERVREFLRGHMPAQANAALMARTEELGAFVLKVRALLSDQVTSRNELRDDATRTEVARRNLRDRHLKPIAKIAKGALGLEPTALKALALPRNWIPDTALLTEAVSVREAAEKYEQVLIDNGRPVDFLAKLDAAIERLRETHAARAVNVGLRAGAGAAVRDQLKRGRKLMELIDGLVADAYEGDVEVLARWRIAKRVKAMPGPRGTGGTADENLPTAA